MHLNATLDLDVVAIEAEDQISVLLELAAPAAETSRTRPPSTLQVVLDRCGSMAGDPLESAKAALIDLVGRLEPTDHFGLVVFDDEVHVAVPAGPLTDEDTVRGLIASIPPGGTTNLSGGYLRGLQEARRVAGKRGATLLLISDGHANVGILDSDKLGRSPPTRARSRVTTSTIGLGLGLRRDAPRRARPRRRRQHALRRGGRHRRGRARVRGRRPARAGRPGRVAAP